MATNRADFVKALRAHWGIKVVLVIWAILGTGSTGLTYAPQSWQDKAYIGQYVPRISLSVWIIGFVILIMFVLFEAAFKAYASAHESQPSTTTQSSPAPGQAGNSFATGGDARIGLEMRDPIAETVYLDDNQVWRIGIGRNRRALTKAVLLPLYFNPMRSDAGLEMKYAKSHLVLTTASQTKPITVAHGYWIDGYWDYIDIEQGETKYIILVLAQPFPPSENLVWISNNRTDRNWSNKTDNKEFNLGRIECTKYECEALVMWGGSSESRTSFKLALDVKQLLQC
jgi:hypothetical protein